MSCQRCHRPVVELSVQGFMAYKLRSCSHCDRRVWTIDNRPAGVDEVLSALRSHESGRRAA